jgi:4-amino-4-deoxy-L-arabinose transferase-like glycosyltransferase
MLERFKKIFSTHFWLILIVALGLFLRLWQLGMIPQILNRDEAALAYNAVLLRETGKDEWGRAWPLSLESFGDYKLPGYVWSLIGVFSVFGYHDWVVKLPSVMAGLGIIVITYFFFTQIFRQSRLTGWIAAFLAAVTPVFFFYSRIAFEANLALCFFLVSMWCLLRTAKTPKLLQKYQVQFLALRVIGIVLLLLTVFTYNTPLLLLPLLLPLVILWHGWKKPAQWLVPVAGVAIVSAIGFSSLLSVSSQKSGITIFSDQDTWLASVKYHQQFSGWEQKILGNKMVFYSEIIFRNLIASLTPSFVVIRGGTHPWHALPHYGHLFAVVYLIATVGVIASAWLLWRKLWHQKQFVKLSRFHTLSVTHILCGWWILIISLAPAVITVDAPHATRSLLFFWLLIVFATFGFQTCWRLSRQKIFMRLVVIGLVVVLAGEATNYYYQYFTSYFADSVRLLQGNFDQVIPTLESDSNLNPVAVVDTQGFHYILTAWYLKMSPTEFFSTVQHHLPDRIGFRYGYKVGKYRFIAQPEDKFPNEKALLYWDDKQLVWRVIK